MEYKIHIKKLREKLVISQEELAVLLGVSFASVNRWEKEDRNQLLKLEEKY